MKKEKTFFFCVYGSCEAANVSLVLMVCCPKIKREIITQMDLNGERVQFSRERFCYLEFTGAAAIIKVDKKKCI